MRRLDEQLAALVAMSPAQLRAEWERLHGLPAPRLGAPLLIMGIGYTLQAKASGKRGRAACAVASLPIRLARRSATIPPGTQLVRSWNGRTVNVVAEESGFLFEGKTYLSLSAIAQLVTGAHWSGPRFFGLGKNACG